MAARAGVVGANVRPAALVTEFFLTGLALHVVAALGFFYVKGAVFARALLHETDSHKLPELCRRLLLLFIFAYVTKRKRNFAEPAYVQVANLAPELVLHKHADSVAVRPDAIL